jgi:hypothetical protein
MNPFGDDHDEMPRNAVLDERSIEAILAGDAGATHPEMSAFVATMRRTAAGPVPAPSPALSDLFLHGFSTEKGDLPATAASNVTGPARQAAGLPKWRKYTMAVKQFVAGLSIAGKLALSAGVAAAATTGAGSAGVLPAPVQHEFARAVDGFVPFDVPDPTPPSVLAPPAGDDGPAAARAVTPSTTVAEAPPTTVEHHEPTTTKPAEAPRPEVPGGASAGGADAPKAAPVTEVPATTVAPHEPATTVPVAPTTTKATETPVPTTLSIRCEQNAAAMSVNCFWTVLTPTQTTQYLLLRIGPDGNRVVLETNDVATSSFTDVHVVAGATYQYMVIARNGSGQTIGHSSYVPVGVVAR